MTDELRRCPFCGCKDIFIPKDDNNETFGWASCGECQAEGPLMARGSDESVIAKAWNKRASDKV